MTRSINRKNNRLPAGGPVSPCVLVPGGKGDADVRRFRARADFSPAWFPEFWRGGFGSPVGGPGRPFFSGSHTTCRPARIIPGRSGKVPSREAAGAGSASGSHPLSADSEFFLFNDFPRLRYGAVSGFLVNYSPDFGLADRPFFARIRKTGVAKLQAAEPGLPVGAGAREVGMQLGFLPVVSALRIPQVPVRAYYDKTILGAAPSSESWSLCNIIPEPPLF